MYKEFDYKLLDEMKNNETIKKYFYIQTYGWTKVFMEAWIKNNTIEIGFDFDAKSGCWTVIDSLELNFITAVNYENLEETIKEYEGLNEIEYTPNSWNSFKESLMIAKSSLTEINVTQEVVDELEDKLNEAKENLILKANKEVLLEKINEAEEIILDEYTEATVYNLQEVLNEAKVISEDENVLQTEVNEAVENLDLAIKGLLKKPIELPNLPQDPIPDTPQDSIIGDENHTNTNNGDTSNTEDNVATENNKNEDNNHNDNLPITGKESLAIIISLSAFIIGMSLLRSKKIAS